jgi:DNA-binding NarL/FixJ family response regulator
VLAEAADMGFPLAVLSDGRSDAIHDHALSVGADAYLLSDLPARSLVARLAALSR